MAFCLNAIFHCNLPGKYNYTICIDYAPLYFRALKILIRIYEQEFFEERKAVVDGLFGYLIK